MELGTVKLITIIADRHLKDELVGLMKERGVSGYTIFEVKGLGLEQMKVGAEEELPTFQIQVLTEIAVAESLMCKISERYFVTDRIIIFEQDVKVLRLNKFEKIAYKTIEGNDDPT